MAKVMTVCTQFGVAPPMRKGSLETLSRNFVPSQQSRSPSVLSTCSMVMGVEKEELHPRRFRLGHSTPLSSLTTSPCDALGSLSMSCSSLRQDAREVNLHPNHAPRKWRFNVHLIPRSGTSLAAIEDMAYTVAPEGHHLAYGQVAFRYAPCRRPLGYLRREALSRLE